MTSRMEQETIIRWAADEDVVSIYTAQPATKAKLEKYGHKATVAGSRNGEASGWFFKVPLEQFRWQAKRRKGRKFSDAERAASAVRLQNAREARLLNVQTEKNEKTGLGYVQTAPPSNAGLGGPQGGSGGAT